MMCVTTSTTVARCVYFAFVCVRVYVCALMCAWLRMVTCVRMYVYVRTHERISATLTLPAFQTAALPLHCASLCLLLSSVCKSP